MDGEPASDVPPKVGTDVVTADAAGDAAISAASPARGCGADRRRRTSGRPRGPYRCRRDLWAAATERRRGIAARRAVRIVRELPTRVRNGGAGTGVDYRQPLYSVDRQPSHSVDR